MTSGPATVAARTLALDLGAPAAVYYGLRVAGVGVLVALVAGAAVPALNAGHTALRHRRVDSIAVLTVLAVLAMLVGTATAVGTGDARALLARGAAVTALTGVWCLAGVVTPHPFCYLVTQALLPHRAGVMDRLWATDPRFRRAWHTISLCWGTTTLVDAGLRVVMAYRLPVNAVPALDTALTVVTIVVLQVPTHLVLQRAGSWHQLFGPHRPDRDRPDDRPEMDAARPWISPSPMDGPRIRSSSKRASPDSPVTGSPDDVRSGRDRS